MIQPPARGISGESLNGAGPATAAVCGNGLAVKSDAEIVAHGLDALMILSSEPRKNSVTREIVHPTRERIRHFNPEVFGAMEDWRTRIRGEDVGPELSSGE